MQWFMLVMEMWVMALLLFVGMGYGQTDDIDDDFTPVKYSPGDDVELAHKYPHLSTSLQEQDRTFMSNEESSQDYAISLVVFPALVSGICFLCILLLCIFLCCRCCVLGCINCCKRTCRLCKKDCCRKSKKMKKRQIDQREKFYAIYSKTFVFLLICSFIAIIWVWVGADHFNDGVNETQDALTAFGNIVEAISNELDEMSVSGRQINGFLNDNTCPEDVSSYLEEIGEIFVDFVNVTEDAARITSSVKPGIDKANDNIDEHWDSYQELVFDLSAVALFAVIAVYALGASMKTAILMRLALLLTIVVSLALCIVVFIEMVIVMGYSDFCMAPTHHIERSLNGKAYDVVHYYSTCEGEGPLFQPVEDSKLYNSLMNETYFDMLEDFPGLSADCREGASVMEASCNDIAANALNIADFARCPYIHAIYSRLLLDGFCSDTYSGIYDIHVSHLATLITFFFLMINAALLYPHFKGKTLRHLCFCFYSKEKLREDDEQIGKDDIVFEEAFADSDDSDDDMDSEEHVEGDVELTLKHTHDDYESANLYEENHNQNDKKFSFVNPMENMHEATMVRVKVDDDEALI